LGRRPRALAAAGAHVVITARDATKAGEEIGTFRAAMPTGMFDFAVLELSSLASVRDYAAKLGNLRQNLITRPFQHG
jgi:NAD(P)-dependent dehydrogenase (short-subunit alcohol dehydrogenase family)